jgi:protein YibB
MGNISIVTAFFDIGRGDWTPDKGLPHYLQRSTETYMERFSHLAKLENDMAVITTPEFTQRILDLRQGRPTIVIEDSLDNYDDIRQRIKSVQSDPNFQKLIHPSQVKNPEYWNADYVLVNFLKSTFVRNVIRSELFTTDLIAWLDFGYCRTADKIPPSKRWSYNFNPDKMHMFNYKDLEKEPSLLRIISTNDVYILGAKIVGGQKAWIEFKDLMGVCLANLLNSKLVDDDQTLMLMSTIYRPQLFDLHRIPDHQLGLDPFVILKDFNTDYE